MTVIKIAGAILGTGLTAGLLSAAPAQASVYDDGFLTHVRDSTSYVIAKDAKCGRVGHTLSVYPGQSSRFNDTQAFKTKKKARAVETSAITKRQIRVVYLRAGQCVNIKNGTRWFVDQEYRINV